MSEDQSMDTETDSVPVLDQTKTRHFNKWLLWGSLKKDRR